MIKFAEDVPVDLNGDPVAVPEESVLECPHENITTYPADPSVGFKGGWQCEDCGEQDPEELFPEES